MSISAALHGVTHHSSTHPHAPANQTQSFTQQLDAARKAGAAPGAGQTQQSDAPGALLSADMLQAMQTIG